MLTETQIRQIRETAEQDGDLRIAAICVVAINPDDAADAEQGTEWNLAHECYTQQEAIAYLHALLTSY